MSPKIKKTIFIMYYLFFIFLGTNLFAQSYKSSDQIFLLLNDEIIEEVENSEIVVGSSTKHPKNPLFIEDKPWEKRFDNLYGNIIYDRNEKIYKCWYSPFIVDYSAKGKSHDEMTKPYNDGHLKREMGICYAYSKDGINWIKPNLGLVEYDGTNENNIIWRGPHGAGIYKDSFEKDPKRKYKMIFQGLSFSTSMNGINWEKAKNIKGVDVAGDTHNNAFWAPTLHKYVGITRSWGAKEEGRLRQVARIESSDFENWSKEQVILEGSGKNDQPYAMPVFYYGGVYLGLLAVYSSGQDRTWTELTWSKDTKRWNRISPGTALIPNSDKKFDYDYGCVYACATPVFLNDEIRIYYGASDYLHFGWRNGSLALATLRIDGFAGYEQKSSSSLGIIKTKTVPYKGQDILINADVYDGGYVKVSMFDENGNEISKANTVKRTMNNGKLKLTKTIKSKFVQLKFDIMNSKLYSFRFHPG
tara:strand:+ start:1104 stop:2519 length:1416 start_codon:yes stop_codon:yes gene_type:complete